MRSRYDHNYTGKPPGGSLLFWTLACFNVAMWGLVIPSMLW